VPTRLIEHHDGVLVLGQSRRKGIEEMLHRLGVRVGQHECKAVVRAWLHGREDVGERETLVAKTGRALAPLPPDVAGSALLSDARFVLKEEADAL
jgi:hypothetical protein